MHICAPQLKLEGLRIMFNNPLQVESRPTGVALGDYTRLTGDDIFGHCAVVDYFYDYWQQKQALGENRPRRADMQPREFMRHMKHVVILDIDTDDGKGKLSLFLRLMGSYVEKYFGKISGQPLSAMANMAAQKRIIAMCTYVLDQRLPALSCTPGFASDMSHLTAFALYMPIFTEDGSVQQIMASIFVEDTLGKTY